MPRVLNKKTDHIPHDAVYIGRPSKWGNPFKMSRTCSREDSVRLYELYLLSNKHLLNSLIELHDKDLVCFCAPEKCHGDVLLRYANKFYCPHCGHFDIAFSSEFVQRVDGIWFNIETGESIDPSRILDFFVITFDSPLTCNSCQCEFVLKEE